MNKFKISNLELGIILVGLVLYVLKMAGLIDWPWSWVGLPLWVVFIGPMFFAAYVIARPVALEGWAEIVGTSNKESSVAFTGNFEKLKAHFEKPVGSSEEIAVGEWRFMLERVTEVSKERGYCTVGAYKPSSDYSDYVYLQVNMKRKKMPPDIYTHGLMAQPDEKVAYFKEAKQELQKWLAK